jgi:hypothetical protein
MAKVTAPLLSMGASGTIGKTMTFGAWKGRPYVRQRVIPANPKSASQYGVRCMMSFLAKQWTNLSAPDKASYSVAAAANSISPFNQFVRENLLRWQTFNTPSQTSPPEEVASAITVTTMTLTGGVGQCTVAITPSTGTAIWGFVLFRSTAEITTPAWSNAVAVIEADGANQVTHVDSPLDPATYHYRCVAFTVDGVKGTVKADASASVT